MFKAMIHLNLHFDYSFHYYAFFEGTIHFQTFFDIKLDFIVNSNLSLFKK
jgi:hypothetical protein